MFNKEQINVLSVKAFRNFIIGRLLYITALRMVFTVIGYLVYEITSDKFQLGLIGLSEVIPAIGLALYAGIIVDKSNKRKLIIQGALLYFCSTLLLITIGYLYQYNLITGKLTVGLLLLFMFITGGIRAFTGPAFNAIIAQLVTKEKLIPASTLSSIAWLSAAILGPLLAGLLLSFCSLVVVFTCISLCVLIALFFIKKIGTTEVLVKKEVNNWVAIKEGIRFVFNTKIIVSAISLDLLAVLFGGAVALLPVFAKDILKVNSIALGWLNSAEYLGSFLIMLLLIAFPMVKRQGQKLIIAVMGFGVCTILFALSTHFWLSFAALIAIGIFDGISVIVRGNIMQLYTPNDMRGRVSSVNSMFINSSNEIGQFESGVAASLLGTVPSVIMGGAITIVVAALVYWRVKVLRNLTY